MKSEFKNWALLIFLACIWGSSFILMKRGMTSISGESIFSDSQVASLRMLIAGLGLLPFALFKLRRLLVKKDFWLLLIVGLSGNFIPAFLFTYAETHISSGLAGIMNSFTPIFTLLVGYLFFSNKIIELDIEFNSLIYYYNECNECNYFFTVHNEF